MGNWVELLQKHPVFASLDAVQVDPIIKQATRRDLQKGELLALQGELWPFLFLVAEGEVEAVKGSAEGRSLLVTTFSKGELFWGLTFFQEEAPLLATLAANRWSTVFLWSRHCLEPVFLANGHMGWELCHLMIQRMQRASFIVDELAFQPVAGRLARLLLEDFQNASEPAISRHLTLDEMAARVGTTREMVCRVLYRFAGKQLIDVTRTEFILMDKEGLARVAEGS